MLLDHTLEEDQVGRKGTLGWHRKKSEDPTVGTQ